MSFQGSRTINTANLIEVQRGIITESTDRGQLHQRIILGTFDGFSIMESKQKNIRGTVRKLTFAEIEI